jgi:hypothetical protein
MNSVTLVLSAAVSKPTLCSTVVTSFARTPAITQPMTLITIAPVRAGDE